MNFHLENLFFYGSLIFSIMNKKLILIPILLIIIVSASIIGVFLIIDNKDNDTPITPHFFSTVDEQMFYYSSPSIDNEGNIYIGTSHKQRWQAEGNEWSEHYYLYSFYPNNTKRWEFKTNNSELVKGDPAIHPDGLIIFVAESYSSINTNDFIPNATYNKLYAVNMEDGTLNWSSPNLVNDINDGSWGVNGLHPAIDSNGYIYVQSQHNISSFYANGTLRWTDLKTLNYAGSPSIYRDTVYFPSGDTDNLYIYAYDTNGTIKSEFKGNQPGANNRYNMISIDDLGRLYAGTDNESFYVLNQDGTLNWTFTISTSNAKVRGNIAIDADGTVYLGTKNNENSEFYAFNSDGTEKWKFQGALQDVYSSPTIMDDGSIFFATEDRYVYRVNKATGNLINRYELQEDVTWSSCTFDNDGTLYIGDMRGFLYAIDIGGIGLAETPWPCLGGSFNRSRCVQ